MLRRHTAPLTPGLRELFGVALKSLPAHRQAARFAAHKAAVNKIVRVPPTHYDTLDEEMKRAVDFIYSIRGLVQPLANLRSTPVPVVDPFLSSKGGKAFGAVSAILMSTTDPARAQVCAPAMNLLPRWCDFAALEPQPTILSPQVSRVLERGDAISAARPSLDRLLTFLVEEDDDGKPIVTAHGSGNLRLGEACRNDAKSSRHTTEVANVLEIGIVINNVVRHNLGDVMRIGGLPRSRRGPRSFTQRTLPRLHFFFETWGDNEVLSYAEKSNEMPDHCDELGKCLLPASEDKSRYLNEMAKRNRSPATLYLAWLRLELASHNPTRTRRIVKAPATSTSERLEGPLTRKLRQKRCTSSTTSQSTTGSRSRGRRT